MGSVSTTNIFPTEGRAQPERFYGEQRNLVSSVCDSLRGDSVALVGGASPEQADHLTFLVAQQFGLADSLRVQAEFASSLGHRHNIGQYFMSVNKRESYQFTSPHSEGSSFTGMQIAAFYCYENTTDGGFTLLFNVNDASALWPSLRERVRRGRSAKILSRGDIARAKALYRLSLPNDVLAESDEILSEQNSAIDGLVLISALAQPKRIYSRILDRPSYAYWDNIGSVDISSAREYHNLLKHLGLLRQPRPELTIDVLDTEHPYRIRDFGIEYASIFKRLLVHKLSPGELIIFNNVTWCHSASNWTPGSGTRKLAAAFA